MSTPNRPLNSQFTELNSTRNAASRSLAVLGMRHSRVFVPLICLALRWPHSAILEMVARFPAFVPAARAIRTYGLADPAVLIYCGPGQDVYISAQDQERIVSGAIDLDVVGPVALLQAQIIDYYGVWIRDHEESTARPEPNWFTPNCTAMISQASILPPVIQETGGACCSDPSGPMCRRTGEPHLQICMACRRVIRADEPFCSVRQGLPCNAAPSEGNMTTTSALTGAIATTTGVREPNRILTPPLELTITDGSTLSTHPQDTLKRARDGDLSREGDTEDG